MITFDFYYAFLIVLSAAFGYLWITERQTRKNYDAYHSRIKDILKASPDAALYEIKNLDDDIWQTGKQHVFYSFKILTKLLGDCVTNHLFTVELITFIKKKSSGFPLLKTITIMDYENPCRSGDFYLVFSSILEARARSIETFEELHALVKEWHIAMNIATRHECLRRLSIMAAQKALDSENPEDICFYPPREDAAGDPITYRIVASLVRCKLAALQMTGLPDNTKRDAIGAANKNIREHLDSI